jgi:hypothetical protein
VGDIEQPARDEHAVIAVDDGPKQLAGFAEPGSELLQRARGYAGRERLLCGSGEDAERTCDRIGTRCGGGSERSEQVVEPKISLG